MDRSVLRNYFEIDSTPDWTCPTCGKGVLRIFKKTFFKEERAFARDRSHEAWEPEWIEYVYSCLLYCTNDQCKEVVSTSGIGLVRENIYQDESGIHNQDYSDWFKPTFFEPPLRIIEIPVACPKAVSDPLLESFRFSFSSPNAAANNIRIAIEQLLTEIKIKRFKLVRGKRRPISLHERISLVPAKYLELKDMLFAIKWLGNVGSHRHGELTYDDVMDAYNLTEHILQQIYAATDKKLKAMAKKINKRKGPAK